MKKSLLSFAVAFCMVLSLLPAAAFAEENAEALVCICEEACTAEAMNVSCPVCGAEGASVESCCKYTAPAAEDPEGGVTPEPTTPPVCICEEACTAEAMNGSCPVCGAEGASVESCCKYTAPTAEDPELTAVEKAQALIDALPMVEELKNADEETVDAVYAAVQAACDALDELSAEELEQVTRVEKLAALLEWFTGPVSTYEEDYSYLEYKIDNGIIKITGLKDGYKDKEEVTIPAKIDGYDVTVIGVDAFAYCTSLDSITIPNSVTSIESGAFLGCSSLTSISIPNSVTSIDDQAFMECSSLKSIAIPSGVTRIKTKSFFNCTGLTSITIPYGITEILNGAFGGCTGLTNITIPNSVTTIEMFAFSRCTGLTRITIPNSVTIIKSNAFLDCNALNKVYYLGTREEWNEIAIYPENTGLMNSNIYFVGNIAQDVTFTPPGDPIYYDGNAKEATVTSSDRGAITVKYYNQNGEAVSPVNAGTYTVKIDIEDSEGYDAISDYEVGRFTILQAENSFTTPLSIENWTYGDTAKAPNAAAKFGMPTYSYSTEEDGIYTTTQPTNAGTYWVKAVVKGTDNYTGLEAKKQFRILPKTYTITYAAGSYGTGTVAAGSKTHDVAFTLSSDTFTRAGYEQTGWTISDGVEKVYDLGGTYTANEDITLYPVWRDIEVPVITGIADGKTYCEAQTVAVSDNDAIKKVTVNDEEVSLDENGQFLLSPSETKQTIIATDKAGNSTTFAITINDGHRDADNNHMCDFCQALLFDCNEGDMPGHNCILLYNPTETNNYSSGNVIPVRHSLHNKAQDGEWIRYSLIDRDGKEILSYEPSVPEWGGLNIFVPENLETDIYTLRVSLMHKDETDAESKEICSAEVRFSINAAPFIEHDKTIDYQTGLTYDVKEMILFICSEDAFENVGYRIQYSLAGGTGEGTLNGSKLTVTKPGTFLVKALVKDWDNGSYVKDYEATATLTVTAYEITYDLDGGTAAGNPAYYGAGDTVTLTAPEKEGFVFLGWSGTDLTGSDNRTVTIPAGSRGERHYTAHWLDTEKPTGKITAGADSWDTFSDGVTFERFYKEARTVTIQGNDNSKEAVGIGYLLSDRELTESELAAKTFEAYRGAFLIEPDHEWIIYAKLTDPTGNTRYINSDGIVLDAAAPVISGIENGKTYCAAQTVTVSDRYDVTVTVNGSPVTLMDGKFTLSPAEGTQTVAAADKAGNQAEMTVTVNAGHTGGEATCKEQAVCKYCGESYGDLDPDNHTGGTEIRDAKEASCAKAGYTGDTYCKGCGEKLSEGKAVSMLPHTDKDKDHFCDVCETRLSWHTGGEATCRDKAVCGYCGEAYGDLDPDNHTGGTEIREAKEVSCTEAGYTGDTYCKGCGEKLSEGEEIAMLSHKDEDNDHLCDVCKTRISECKDENPKDHKCDICGATISECEDKNPKDHKCDICGATLSECEDKDPKDHKCDICGATLSEHAGGTATCKEQAVCEYCGEAYGETDSSRHDLEKIPAKAATVTETGNIEYWQCKECGDIFSDPDGKNKIELKDTVLEKLPPEIIEGKGQSMTEGEKKAMSFKSNAAFSDFIGVEVDGRTLDEKNYTATEGSTVVTLKEEYAAALPAGEHTIGIVSANGTASTAFTVTAKQTETETETETGTETGTGTETETETETENQTETVSSEKDSQAAAAKPAETETASPATGDDTPLGIMIGVMIGALALILAVLFLRRRGRREI